MTETDLVLRMAVLLNKPQSARPTCVRCPRRRRRRPRTVHVPSSSRCAVRHRLLVARIVPQLQQLRALPIVVRVHVLAIVQQATEAGAQFGQLGGARFGVRLLGQQIRPPGVDATAQLIDQDLFVREPAGVCVVRVTSGGRLVATVQLGLLLAQLDQALVLFDDLGLVLRHLGHLGVARGAHAVDHRLDVGDVGARVADLLRQLLDAVVQLGQLDVVRLVERLELEHVLLLVLALHLHLGQALAHPLLLALLFQFPAWLDRNDGMGHQPNNIQNIQNTYLRAASFVSMSRSRFSSFSCSISR